MPGAPDQPTKTAKRLAALTARVRNELAKAAASNKPGRGGYRPGSGRKSHVGAEQRSEVVSQRVSKSVAAWLKSQPGNTVERLARSEMQEPG